MPRFLRAIGLEPLTEEGQVVHIHQHLDLYVDGDKVTVPASIGIGPQDAFISDLHTHDDSGIMHVGVAHAEGLRARPVLRRVGAAAQRHLHRQRLREG